MPLSLLEQLPDIVAQGRKQAEKVLRSVVRRQCAYLQTCELVLPAKAVHKGSAPLGNRLIHGDNWHAMAALLRGDEHTPSLRAQVDLICIAPPFESQAGYEAQIRRPGQVTESLVPGDIRSVGMVAFLTMLTPRLVLMRELLAESGSICVCLDWRVGHYVKLVMDAVFGRECLVNELMWSGDTEGRSPKSKEFIKPHRTIFIYRKNDRSPLWGEVFQSDRRTNVKSFKYADAMGAYQLVSVDRPGGGGYLYDLGLGEKAPKNGYGMPYETARGWLAQGILVVQKGKVPRRKVYKNIQKARSRDVVGDATQTPAHLLERIVAASTYPGSLVADFYGGSGTTAVVAEQMGRRWVTTESGKPACMRIRKRLSEQGAGPFLYQTVTHAPVAMATAVGRGSERPGDLARMVLLLYGAQLLPSPNHVTGCQGLIAGSVGVTRQGSKTLVLVDEPHQTTDLDTLVQAVGLRDTLMGGWERVVVLGWSFEAMLGGVVAGLQDPRLEVLQIAPDLLGWGLHRAGGRRRLGQRCFSSLAHLNVYPIVRQRAQEQERLRIRLKGYAQLSPDAAHLDDINYQRLRAVVRGDPLVLVDYWAVDPDYDGKVFRAVWQSYRSQAVEERKDVMRVVTEAELVLPWQDGPRKVCVRSVDVLGLEAQVVVTVDVLRQSSLLAPW